MTALPWPVTPILGQVFKGFAYTRAGWTKAKPRLVAQWTNVQVFRSGGPYVPSDDLLYVIAECLGPGGGGGSGGYSRSTLPADAVAGGVEVTIGAGGLVSAGQVGGTKTSGDTSFGGLVVAYGGVDARATDGSGTVVSAHGIPGAGGAVGIGDFAMPGASGGMWCAMTVNIAVQHLSGAVPGLGGQLFGGAMWPPAAPNASWVFSNVNGANGLMGSGAGGGGAQVNTGSTPITMFGGAGGTGLCVVTEFCGTDGEGPPIEPIPPGWPPGVPFRVDVRARVVHDPWGLHPMPVKK